MVEWLAEQIYLSQKHQPTYPFEVLFHHFLVIIRRGMSCLTVFLKLLINFFRFLEIFPARKQGFK